MMGGFRRAFGTESSGRTRAVTSVPMIDRAGVKICSLGGGAEVWVVQFEAVSLQLCQDRTAPVKAGTKTHGHR
jgi:hypothetical protein